MLVSVRRILRQLYAHERGNTYAIVAAALIPITAMIGSGLDISRAYMAKNRMQNACDAGSLAARRVMKNDVLSDDVISTGKQFFNFNFPQNAYQTEAFEPSVTKPETGVIRIAASTRIPTSIMYLFGIDDLPLNVDCDASLNFVNTDVMLVLDMSTSMTWNANNNNTANPASNSRMAALKEAVIALYDELKPTQTQLEANGLRLRYGIVNYSTAANVGSLIKEVNSDLSYIMNTAYYETRVDYYNTPVYIANTPTSPRTYWEYFKSGSPGYTTTMSQATSITQAHCLNFMNNTAFSRTSAPTYSFTATPTSNGATVPSNTIAYTFPGDGAATDGGANGEWGWAGAPDVTTGSGDSYKSCRRKRTDTTTTYTTRYRWTSTSYQKATIDTSSYKTGATVKVVTNNGNTGNPGGTVADAPSANRYFNPVQLAAAASNSYTTESKGTAPNVTTNTIPSGTSLSTVDTTWKGCIEERQTVKGISGTSIPSGAYDLDVNLIPSSDATRWKPYWPEVVWVRSAGTTARTSGTFIKNFGASYYYACAPAGKRLQTWKRDTDDGATASDNFTSYINDLSADGYTYHDIGMLWAARLISKAGIFSDSPETYNQMPVNRHIIFMTDGDLQADSSARDYNAWGVETNSRRVLADGKTANDTNVSDAHVTRLKMICNAARSAAVGGASVWIIAFGPTFNGGANSDIADCADNSGQIKVAADKAALIAKFKEIGNQIGALRLVE